MNLCVLFAIGLVLAGTPIRTHANSVLEAEPNEEDVIRSGDSLVLGSFGGVTRVRKISGSVSLDDGRIVEQTVVVTDYRFSVLDVVDGVVVPDEITISIRGGRLDGIETPADLVIPRQSGLFAVALRQETISGRQGYLLGGARLIPVAVEGIAKFRDKARGLRAGMSSIPDVMSNMGDDAPKDN